MLLSPRSCSIGSRTDEFDAHDSFPHDDARKSVPSIGGRRANASRRRPAEPRHRIAFTFVDIVERTAGDRAIVDFADPVDGSADGPMDDYSGIDATSPDPQAGQAVRSSDRVFPHRRHS